MKETNGLKGCIEFLIKCDDMKDIERRNLNISSRRRENDAEHSWSLSMMAITLYEFAAEKVNLERVLKMVTVHDLVELYAGDVFAYDSERNIGKAQREAEAADKLFSMLPEYKGTELRQLWEEFDRMDTPDSRYAAACDRLQPLINNFFTEGHTWQQYGVHPDSVLKRNEVVKTAIPDMWKVVEYFVAEGKRLGYFDKALKK